MTSSPIASGPIFQLAWVVDDLDDAEASLSASLGVDHWTRFEGTHFGPDACRFRGQPADFVADISLAYAGEQQLELIRPVSGENLYAEHLAKQGPGLHHVAHEVPDLDVAVADAEARGLSVAMAGHFPGGLIRFAYLEGAAVGASHLELIQLSDDMKAMFASMR